MQGQVLSGRYYIIRHLASGAFGNTYLSEDRQRPHHPLCVVKQLIPQVVNAITLRLFHSEAEVLEKLGNHDQIPRLYAYFQENQEFYLVQEFIPGHNLDDEIIPNQKLTENHVIQLLREILEVLAFVHQQNVIHRDLKPNNIRRRDDGKIVLIDFGAVKQITSQTSNAPIQTNLSTVNIGTPGYMPSEQSNGKPKLNSDIYAVGMICIQALTGIFPHQLPEDPKTGEIVWRNYAQVSDALANVLDKMIRYDFRQRYESALEALAAIDSLNTPINPTLVSPNSVTPTLVTSTPETIISKTKVLPNSSSNSITGKVVIATGITTSVLLSLIAIGTNFLKPTTVISNNSDHTSQTIKTPSISASIQSTPTLASEPTQTTNSVNQIAQSRLNSYENNTIKEFYFISDTAYENANDADEEVNRLKKIGYNQALKFWIPDYPNLSGKSLFIVSPSIFMERNSCAEFLQNYANQKPESYCAFASKNSNANADRLYASSNRPKSTTLNTYSSKTNQSEGFYFIADSAFLSANEADKNAQKLRNNGYSMADKFWIPDYPNLSGKPLFVVYPAQFKERQSCANFLRSYRQQSKSSYCAFASKDRNVPADRF